MVEFWYGLDPAWRLAAICTGIFLVLFVICHAIGRFIEAGMGEGDDSVVTLPPGNLSDRADMMASLRKQQARAARRGR